MPLVSVSAGVTVKFGDPYGNNYLKMNFEIADIDTSLDLESQLTEASSTINTAIKVLWNKIDAELDDKVNQKVGKGKK